MVSEVVVNCTKVSFIWDEQMAKSLRFDLLPRLLGAQLRHVVGKRWR